MFLIPSWMEKRLLEVAYKAAPRETGGLIIRGETVVVLENKATGNSTFQFELETIRAAVCRHEVPLNRVAEDVVLWHTHPGGGVGPSREDMRNRTPLRHHLVLALVEDTLVPTWY